MTSENREDYLINILRLTEGDGVVRTSKLASFMNVAPASVTEMLHVLADAGYVDYVRYRGVSLTEVGLAYARNLRRKHHVVERFLTDVLDVEHGRAHEEACLIEHSISDDSINKICRMIGAKVNHDCTTCNKPCDSSSSCSMTAADLRSGESATISHLQSGDGGIVRRLVSMGFVPGRTITMENFSESGPRIMRIGESTIALDSELTRAIRVGSP